MTLSPLTRTTPARQSGPPLPGATPGSPRRAHMIALLAACLASGAAGCKKDEPAPAPRSGAESITSHVPAPAVDLPLAPGPTRTAVFAGGCFWCTEAVFEELAGAGDVISGYAGGSADTARYGTVSSGDTGHAEAIKVPYDPGKISYGTLLRVFFATHDPTQLDRQGPDAGKQYRSAVFFGNEDERRIARAYIDQLDAAHVFDRPIVTTLEPLAGFYPAEGYHQDYARRNPDELYIQLHARGKVDKVHKQFPGLVDTSDPGREKSQRPE